MGGWGCGLGTQRPGPHAEAGHTTPKAAWLSLSFPFIPGNSVFLLTGDKISRSSLSKLERLKAGGLPSSQAVLGLSTGCCQWEQSLAVHEETPGRHFAMGSKVLFFSGNSLPLPRISTESTVQVSGTNAVTVVTLSPHVCPQLQITQLFQCARLSTFLGWLSQPHLTHSK